VALQGLDQGLDAAGRIRREGDLSRVDPVFVPLVSELERGLRAGLGDRVDSLYLYGSIPRGTAVPGRSDLDVSVVLRGEVTPEDRLVVAELAAELDRSSDVVDGVGILVDPRAHLLSVGERYDGAFHISCLCTPLWGPDLAAVLPEQRPVPELGRAIGRGAAATFARLVDGLASGTGDTALLCRNAGRRVARLAFAAVLARWPGWTSDPVVIARVVTTFYPDRSAELERCVRLGWGHLHGDPAEPADAVEALDLLRTSGPWWVTEHERATRPQERAP
jgi:predicted nucleotidyltransferase